MERYNVIREKNQREIVLLKSYPCAWGKCTFCDYIDDNSRNEQEMLALNSHILSRVTGEMGVLEVINSGSCFELPAGTREEIRKVVRKKGIGRLFFESHWMYRKHLEEMRYFMGVPITYKIGVETFDNDFREKVLNKHADFKTPEEVAEYFDSPCIMVGIRGQTKQMIDTDIQILKKYFRLGTINVFTDNTTPIRQDPELVEWFVREYEWLREDPAVEVLYENTDFGVGD